MICGASGHLPEMQNRCSDICFERDAFRTRPPLASSLLRHAPAVRNRPTAKLRLGFPRTVLPGAGNHALPDSTVWYANARTKSAFWALAGHSF